MAQIFEGPKRVISATNKVVTEDEVPATTTDTQSPPPLSQIIQRKTPEISKAERHLLEDLNTESPLPTQTVQSEEATNADGSIAQAISNRKNEAIAERKAARLEWGKSITDASNARMALVERMKPKDTTDEQRALRNTALGQSIGELLGAIFGGIVGLREGGSGYVPKMQGLAGKTLDRLTALKDKGIIAEKEYQGLILKAMNKNIEDRSTMVGEDYKTALNREKTALDLADYATKDDLSFGHKKALAERQIVANKELQESKAKVAADLAKQRHSYSLSEIRTSAAMKERSNKKTEDNGYEKDAAEALLAEIIAPLMEKYNIDEKTVRSIQKAVEYSGRTWDDVTVALEGGLGPESIVYLFLNH